MSDPTNRTTRKIEIEVKPTLETLESRENPTVNYYGGALLPSVEAQAVYYGSGWSANASSQTYTTGFLQTITQSAYMDALHQAGYGVSRGSTSASAHVPISLTSGSTITDASIRAELSAEISNGTLATLDPNRLYVVFVQPNVAINLGAGQGTTQQGILGYHGAFSGPGGAAVHYAVIAYPGGAAGNSSLGTSANDQLTAVTSHELAEAVTDPNVNYSTLGWYDPQRGEIGDITENNPSAYVRLNGYLVQEVATQNDQLLSINLSPPAPPVSPPPPVAPPPAPSTTTTTTTLTAGHVSYHGWYATVSLTITVKPGSGTVQPGGTVELIYGGRVLGTATLHLVNGVETATFNVMFFANGNYTFSAQYVGNAQFLGSTSHSTTVHV